MVGEKAKGQAAVMPIRRDHRHAARPRSGRSSRPEVAAGWRLRAVRLLTAALATSVALGTPAATAGNEPSPALPFWRLTDPARPDAPGAYLLATVAVPDSTLLRFDRRIADAFDEADRLVLADDVVLVPQNALVGSRARLPEGVTLRDRIGPGPYRRYTDAIVRGGFAAGTGDVTAPWFAVRVVESADRRRAGFAEARELERFFASLAAERATKAVLPVEPSHVGYDRLAALPDGLQAELLEGALAASTRSAETLAATHAAWSRGDEAALAEALDVAAPTGRESIRRTRDAGTKALTGEIARLLAPTGSGPAFVVADAAQVVGANGVLARLRERGVRVEQLRPIGETARARPAADRPAAPEPVGGRVLIVGIDGATWRVLGPLIEAGRAPFLASLARTGASGALRSHRPLHSPRIWNSVATGKTPEKHGILGFTFRDESGVEHLFTGEQRRAHALWNIVSRSGRKVGVVNWWNTHPPEVVRGVVVSDHAKPTRLAELERLAGLDAPAPEPLAPAKTEAETGATVYPPAWSRRVATIHADPAGLTAFDDPFLGRVGLPAWSEKEDMSRRYREDAAAVRIALAVEAELRPELLMVFLPGIDRVSHRIWGALEPDFPYPPHLVMRPHERTAAREALFAYYEFTDALVALLARGFGPEDLVMVLSDHGFEAGQHLGGLTGIHESEKAVDGVLFARGPGISAGSDTSGTGVNDVTPTVLTWLGLPSGLDMDGRPAAFLERPPPEAIATHDTAPIERVGVGPSGSEEEILEQLRALGYLE